VKNALTTSLVLACVAAVSPAAATAATPFQLTAVGGKPQVAVDSAGNGHFVWDEGVSAGADVTHYCRVPRGGRACAASSTFVPTASDPDLNDDFDGPKVFVGGSVVIVMTARCCGGYPPAGSNGVVIYISNDGGQTFGAERVVGDSNISGDAIVGPTGSISTISDVVTGGTFYQATTPGGFTDQSANLGDSGPSQSYSGSLALIDANTPIATFDDLDTTFWRRYDGSGSLNDVANWTPTATVGLGTEGRLAFGPAGVWLLYQTGEPGGTTFVQRAYTGSGWGSPVAVTETGDPIFADFFQDAGGRHHAVWLQGDRALVYRRADDAVNYGPTTELAPPTFDIFNMEVAAGADGEGWVVWDSNGDHDAVGAVALEVAPELPTLGETVGVSVVKGEVRIKLPPGSGAARASQKGSGFVPLTEARTIPVRSILDTRKGTVAIRAARNRAGKTQSGRFSAGVFQVLQSRKRAQKGLTTLKLKGSTAAFRRCGGKGSASARAALSRRAIRRLRARARGRYRTRGRHSAATVRGTVWNMTDSCAGTLTTVKRGKVAVRDFRLKKTILVRAGKSYFARAR
jgi:hypothetical protein